MYELTQLVNPELEQPLDLEHPEVQGILWNLIFNPVKALTNMFTKPFRTIWRIVKFPFDFLFAMGLILLAMGLSIFVGFSMMIVGGTYGTILLFCSEAGFDLNC